MRSRSRIVLVALLGALALPAASALAQSASAPDSQALDVGFFYDPLAPHGEWIETAALGWTWAPRVASDWRPYTRGRWASTDQGWHWDSDEAFGWAVFHYGRWVDDPAHHWLWVPGTEWAPAWVSWRHGDGVVGWAPLPPGGSAATRQSLATVAGSTGASGFVFVNERHFLDRGIDRRLLSPTRSGALFGTSRDVTHYSIDDTRIVNVGIAVDSVERAIGRPVPRTRAIEVDRIDPTRRANVVEVIVYRPLLRAAPGRRPANGRSLAAAGLALPVAQPAVRMTVANGGTAFVHAADRPERIPGEDGPSYTNAEVVALDSRSRTLVIRTAQGEEVKAELDDTLTGFGDLVVGDHVILTVRTGPGWARISSISRGNPPARPAGPLPGGSAEPAASVEARAVARAAFNARVASLAQQAERVDRIWNEFRSACDTQAPTSNEGARGWFALWEGSLRSDLSSGFCRDLFNQIVALGEPVKEGMTAAEDQARKTLPPGEMREVRRRHLMDWGGWSLPRPQTLDQ